jgi:hypothetical protein
MLQSSTCAAPAAMESGSDAPTVSQKKSIRPSLSVADSLASLLNEVRAEKQEVQQLHRESRKRINRGVRVAAASSRSAEQPALW